MKIRRQANRRAFSLLEILIVLAILVVLIGLVAPRLLRSQEKASLDATKLQLASVEGALKTFKVDFQRYPTTEEGLKILIEKPSDEDLADKWYGPYFEDKKIPKDAWGKPFTYEYDGKGDKPKIASLGKDGEENTEDDIKNYSDDDSSDSSDDSSSDEGFSDDLE